MRLSASSSMMVLNPCRTPSTVSAAQLLKEPRSSALSSSSNARFTQLGSELRWSARLAAPLLPNGGARVVRRQEHCSVVCMVLPAGDAEIVSSPAGAKWEARALKSFSMAELEARKLKYPNTGTESLLLGILTEGTSEAAKFLRKNGVTLFGAKDEIINLLGKADMYYFSPEHPPLTSSAQKAIAWAADPANKPEWVSGEELSTTMLIIGIWAQKGSAGQKILEKLGINDDKIAKLSDTMKNSPNKRGNYQQLAQ